MSPISYSIFTSGSASSSTWQLRDGWITIPSIICISSQIFPGSNPITFCGAPCIKTLKIALAEIQIRELVKILIHFGLLPIMDSEPTIVDSLSITNGSKWVSEIGISETYSMVTKPSQNGSKSWLLEYTRVPHSSDPQWSHPLGHKLAKIELVHFERKMI